MKGEYVAKGEQMEKKYLKEANALAKGFVNFEINVIPSDVNVETDTLSK